MKATPIIQRNEKWLRIAMALSFLCMASVLAYLLIKILVPKTIENFLTWREYDPEWGSARENLFGAYLVLALSVVALIGSIGYLVAAIGLYCRRFSLLSTFAACGIMGLPLGWEHCYFNIAGIIMVFAMCHSPFQYQPTKKPVSN